MARKATETGIEQHLITESEAAAVQEMAAAESELSVIQQSYTAEQREMSALIHEHIGRKQAFKAVEKLSTVSSLLAIQKIKESKLYRGFEYIDENQKCQRISSFEEYCLVIEGRSRQSVDLDLANMNAFGEEFFDAMSVIGIGPSKMRDMRKLPENEKQALLEVAKTGEKESFIDLASSIIAKHEAEKTTATNKISELEKTLVAKDSVLKDKNSVIDSKLDEIARLKMDAKKHAHTDWPNAFGGYIDQAAILRKSLKQIFTGLEVIRADALKHEAKSEEEEKSLEMARGILATELVGIHNECAELLSQIGLQFDRTLGAFTEARINLLSQ
jgi:hypothetical protein